MIVLLNPNDWKRQGRMGNLMFKCAFITGIGLKYGIPYYVNEPWSYNKYFKIQLPITNVRPTKDLVDQLPYYFYHDITIEPHINYGVNGYFQSERYFENCKEYIKEFFTLLPEYSDPLKEKFKNHFHRVGIHVRRTDFIGNGCTPALPLTYYDEALTYFPDDEFLVCSDDINWCKEQKVFSGDRFFFQEERHPDIFDMYLLSYCKSIIMANSSFSWWSAWLGEREGFKIIAPKLYFGGWYSGDIIPERWPRVGPITW